MLLAGPMMKISDFLSPTDVPIGIRASIKRLLIQELALRGAASVSTRRDQIASALLKREDLGSTGMGERRRYPARSA